MFHFYCVPVCYYASVSHLCILKFESVSVKITRCSTFARIIAESIRNTSIFIEMERFVGKIAVVTGSSFGIGECVSKGLLKRGVNVVGLARNVPKLQVRLV